MPNPNEEQRKLEERKAELHAITGDLRCSKSIRQEASAELARLEGRIK